MEKGRPKYNPELNVNNCDNTLDFRTNESLISPARS